jgi:hypothetical protein
VPDGILPEGATTSRRKLEKAIDACRSGQLADAKTELAFTRLQARESRRG